MEQLFALAIIGAVFAYIVKYFKRQKQTAAEVEARTSEKAKSGIEYYEIVGTNNKRILRVEGDEVRISLVKHGDEVSHQSLHFSRIVSVDIQPPAVGFSGYIQFVLPGGHPFSHICSTATTQAIGKAALDEHSILFTSKRDLETAKAVRDRINEWHTKSNNTLQQATLAGSSVADELAKLKGLLDQQAITQEEYDGLKKKALGL